MTASELSNADLLTAALVATGLLVGVLALAGAATALLRLARRRRTQTRAAARRARRAQIAGARAAQAASVSGAAQNQTTDELLAVLSHELRTPLNAIQGWAHVLSQDGVAAEVVKRGADAIRRNVAAQEQLIAGLLDTAQLAAGRIRLARARLRFAALLDDVLAQQRPALEAKGVALRTEVSAAVRGAEVLGDAARLSQVISNLLSNALKFTPTGGEITVSLERGARGLRLRVSDTGEGVAAEFLPHVFAPFRQADSSSRRRAGGLGLGLSLVKALVERHGGTIEASSPGPGRGTSIVVTLPEASRAAPASERAYAERSGARLAGCSLLVVEDHADSRDALQSMLELEGARTTAAGSVAEAIEALSGRLASEPPAAIICDIELPREDGYRFLQKLRALQARRGTPPGQGIPVVALTAYADGPHRARALAAGFSAHLAKPIDAVRLVETVGKACRARG